MPDFKGPGQWRTQAERAQGRKIDSPFTRNPLQLIDSVEMLDHSKKWQELYQSIVIKASR